MEHRRVVSAIVIPDSSADARSDYAVLMMALHSAIQVFYPSTLVSSDGLYPCRRYVYVGGFIIPILMAGLAFVNPTHAYVSQGAFCTLPIRPFWYRLALTWIPRYIIILVIIGLAIAIYTHVGFEFRAYSYASNMDVSFQSFKTSNDSATPPSDKQEYKMEDISFELTPIQSRPQPQRRKSSVDHDIFISQRRASSAPALSPGSMQSFARVSIDDIKAICSLSNSSLHLPRTGASTARPSLPNIPSGQSVTSPLDRSSRPDDPSATEPIATPFSSSSTRTPSPSSPDQIRLAKQRQRIHRQLRLMFIYPLIYTLMWLIPFAMHCMNYWHKWAMHPVEFLFIGSSICITLMGFTDALIFSLREKPWRGIEGSNGTFWGSFVCKRRAAGDVEVDREGVEISGSGRGRGSQSYRTSASGEFARIAAEQARARLDFEREERLAFLELKQDKRLEKGESGESKFEGKVDEEHGGLNVGDGEQGQVYDDNGLEDDTVKTPYNQGKKSEV